MDSFTVQKILIKITDDVIVDPIEVSSVQSEVVHKYCGGSPSDSSTYIDFQGSVMTLKNGRKIYVKFMTPEEILHKLGGVPNVGPSQVQPA